MPWQNKPSRLEEEEFDLIHNLDRERMRGTSCRKKMNERFCSEPQKKLIYEIKEPSIFQFQHPNDNLFSDHNRANESYSQKLIFVSQARPQRELVQQNFI